MPRPLALFTGLWADQPLHEVCAKAQEWGYQSLDLACWGEHLQIQRALSEPDYCRSILETLERHELSLISLSNQPVGQAVADTVDERHKSILPEWVWGDGDPAGVSARAAQEIVETAKVAQQLGVNLVVSCTGSTLPAVPFHAFDVHADYYSQCWSRFSQVWKPILDAFAQLDCRLASEMGAAQTAFDVASAETTIEALDGHPAFGFALTPSQLHWLGVDPCEVVRGQADRLLAVRVQDCSISLNGRNCLLGSLWPDGDFRRGWNSRVPGLGNIDWPGLLRTLNQVNYNGSLCVAFHDRDIDRDHGAIEAIGLLRRLDLPMSRGEGGLFG